jgi:hypothetical protein
MGQLTCQWCGAYRLVAPVRVNGVVKAILCYQCFGRYAETGQRADQRPHDPGPGPISGLEVSPAMMRRYLAGR